MKICLVIILAFLLYACAPSPESLSEALSSTQDAIPTVTAYPTYTAFPTYTPNPTLTPYPTQTPYPTPQPTIIVKYMNTPTPDTSDPRCFPMTQMEYSDNSTAFTLLQAYVATLDDVRQVSYTVPERLYSNALSHIVFVRYVSDDDGELYSKRYIVYVDEFGWNTGVFSIDGQCWVDGPHR